MRLQTTTREPGDLPFAVVFRSSGVMARERDFPSDGSLFVTACVPAGDICCEFSFQVSFVVLALFVVTKEEENYETFLNITGIHGAVAVRAER